MLPEVRYVWNAKLLRIVDGDTADFAIDVAFRATRTERLRLLGINCPEVHGPTAEAGRAATEFARQWFIGCVPQLAVVVETFKSDVFGRYLARVYRQDGACLNDDLLASGHAVVFKGERP